MTPARTQLWRRFWRNRAAAASVIVLVAMVLICFVTLFWSAPRMRQQDLSLVRQPPSAAQPFGTDELGRSLLWRTAYGGAISLSLGLLAAGLATLIGTAYGLIAGYVGGRCDEIMMRIVDVLYALPYMLLVMLFAVSIGAWLEQARFLGTEWSRFVVVALAIGGVSWLTMARVVRGQVLSIREQPYIEAARALGVPVPRILVRHILPNLVGPIVVFATLTVPQAILQESFLSFLGVGVQPPQATWGSLAADGVRLLNPIQIDWWLLVFPCAALSVTLLALNFVGDGLRDALDVRGK
ncbi:MAG: ABC transporter permease [Phycisphaerae bacterium]|jgi:ABC-type dipeptide/oligopeptide/nickel transport system permease subunit